jgi:alanyl-tRNA synthetase
MEKLKQLLSRARASAGNTSASQKETRASCTSTEIVPGVFCHSQETTGLDMPTLKGRMDQLKKQTPQNISLLIQKEDERTTLLLGLHGVSLDAQSLLKDLLTPWGGRGGGRPDMAQGGMAGTPALETLHTPLEDILRAQLSGSQ